MYLSTISDGSSGGPTTAATSLPLPLRTGTCGTVGSATTVGSRQPEQPADARYGWAAVRAAVSIDAGRRRNRRKGPA